MPSPFPGMDPYLETPDLWPDVHQGIINNCQNFLNRALRPNYVARVELRVYVSNDDDPARQVIPDARIETSKGSAHKATRSTANGAPALAIAEPMIVPITLDEEIEEARLEIKHVKTGALVTVIEVMSPSNKIAGSVGRESFMKKRRETLASDVHWVEIDLLRAGVPTMRQPAKAVSDYRAIVSTAADYRRARYWPIYLRQVLPVIGIPLLAPDPDAPLDLAAVLNAAYDRAAYDRSVDYTAPPDPPLRKDDTKWADKLLRAKGLR
jgi:hypothetical protein